MRFRSQIKMRINEEINERDISITYIYVTLETIEKFQSMIECLSKNLCHVLSIYLSPGPYLVALEK